MGQIGSMWYSIGAKTTDLEKGLSSSKDKFVAFGNSAKISFSEINQGIEVFQKMSQVIGDVIVAVNKSLNQRQEYVSSVVDEARLLGLDTEETSKLIQASDDLFISQEKLNTALQAATRQGIDVSINGLQKLSDKYLALNPGVERSQFLLQTFGRSGSDMGKLMEQGAEGIRTSMNAVEDWMIVTKDTVLTVQEYKQSMDKAEEANQNISTSIANGSMPSVTNMNEAYAKMVTNLNETKIAEKLVSDGAWMLEGALTGLSMIFNKKTIWQQWAEGAQLSTEKINENTDAIIRNANTVEILSKGKRGSIYDQAYQGGARGTHGSIYDTGINAGGASGLSMIVPAGYPNDSFKIGASTGEPVAIGKNAVNAGGEQLLQEIQGMRRELSKMPLMLRDAFLFARNT